MKKKLNGLLMFTLVLGMSVALYGCSKDDDSNTLQTATPQTTQGTNPGNTGETEVLKDASWAENAVCYEIFVRSFYDADGDGIGDFKGVEEKIPYLKSLGVNAIWLMPMMEATKYHGYDVVDYYSTESDYGTMEDFEHMLKACHDNDIKVILDFVVNHTSNENAWFKDALYNKDSKYRDYYFIYDEQPEVLTSIRYHKETNQFYYANYDYIMPDLDYSNQAVRDEIKNVAKFWLDKGIDGFRLDGSKEIDVDANITHSWWKEFSEYVASINPSAFIVGENWNGTYSAIAPFYSDMISSFNFPVCSMIESMARGKMVDVASSIMQGREIYKKATEAEDSAVNLMIDSVMINNHDMMRVVSRVGGNGQARLAAAIQLTLPGTPFIYYGDELGQLGGSGDLTKREPFDWYKSLNGTGFTDFKKSCNAKLTYDQPDDGISFEEEDQDENSMLNYYRKLIAIRKANPVLFTGEYETVGTCESTYAYRVKGAEDGSTLLVIHNQSEEETYFPIMVDGQELISGNKITAGDDITLGGYESVIIKYNSEASPVDADQFVNEGEKLCEVTFDVTLPAETPENEKIYIAGSFNGWNECDPDYVLNRTSKTSASITIKLEEGTSVDYKFTRGTWTTREQSKDHKDKIGEAQGDNRKITVPEESSVATAIEIESWFDIRE